MKKYNEIKEFANKFNIEYYAPKSGIGHQVMCEQGFVTPGSLVVASDSHSNMYGALGCLGTPVVRTDAAEIWATGKTWWQIPKTVKVVFKNKLKILF
jgi:homoaconitate hydratase